MRVANAHWVKEATYLFADSDMERLSELGKKGFSDGIGNVALIVTLPFVFEGTGKMTKASEALKSLLDIPVKVLNNEDLTERYPGLNFINAFEYSDKEALNAMESGLI